MGQRFKSVLYGQKDFLKYAAAEAHIAQLFYDHGARTLGYETDPLSSVYGIGMNLLVGQLTFGPLAGYMHYKAADANLKKGQTFKEIYSFFETEFGKAASVRMLTSPQFQKADEKLMRCLTLSKKLLILMVLLGYRYDTKPN